MKRIALTALAFLAAAQLSACMTMMHAPSDPELYAPTQMSANQMYRVTMSTSEPIKVGRLHQWNIKLTTAEGAPVDSASITVDGGMPQHGHGLPTRPIVTKHLGEGEHLVEGMKFNMGGWWVVKFAISSAQGSDIVTFNLEL
jgi:hypothetical protein